MFHLWSGTPALQLTLSMTLEAYLKGSFHKKQTKHSYATHLSIIQAGSIITVYAENITVHRHLPNSSLVILMQIQPYSEQF